MDDKFDVRLVNNSLSANINDNSVRGVIQTASSVYYINFGLAMVDKHNHNALYYTKQEIDSLLSSGGGSSIDTGIDNPVYWPVSQYNEEFDASLSSDWITVNMGSNIYEVKKSALVVKLAGGNLALRGVVKPIPPGYWRCYAKVGLSAMTRGSLSDWVTVGIMLYDQNNDSFAVLINHRSYDSNTINLNMELWNSATSWRTTPMYQPRMQYFHPYLAIAKKPTGYDFGFSYDGVEFCWGLLDYSLTTLTPTHIGIATNALIGTGANAVMTMHWMRFEIL